MVLEHQIYATNQDKESSIHKTNDNLSLIAALSVIIITEVAYMYQNLTLLSALVIYSDITVTDNKTIINWRCACYEEYRN